MFAAIATLLAPDYCCSCGYIGSVLCEGCYNDIKDEPYNRCLACLRPTSGSGKCSSCRLSYSRSWAVGVRESALEKLIDISKFESVRAGCYIQARLLNDCLPSLPENLVIVCIPTTRPHIRQRGYGHAELIAKTLADLRNCRYQAIIERINHSMQHGSTRRDRQKQAESAYRVRQPLNDATTYLLIDDVYTTGFTVHYATKALLAAGAGEVWVAVSARQPLD